MIIEPSDGVVLVELAASNYGDFQLPEKSYDSISYGVIVAISPVPGLAKDWIGRTAYWRMYKDDCRLTDDNDRKLALIEIKDILGTSYASNDSATRN
jgi:hypothetical protein